MDIHPWAAAVVHFLHNEDPETLAKFEADLQRLSASLGTDVTDYWDLAFACRCYQGRGWECLGSATGFPQKKCLSANDQILHQQSF